MTVIWVVVYLEQAASEGEEEDKTKKKFWEKKFLTESWSLIFGLRTGRFSQQTSWFYEMDASCNYVIEEKSRLLLEN